LIVFAGTIWLRVCIHSKVITSIDCWRISDAVNGLLPIGFMRWMWLLPT